jgi:hypothetical protein
VWVFDFPFWIALPLLSRGLFLKTMFFVSANKLSILYFGPNFQLYLQLNNLNKLKLWQNLMLCKNWDFRKTSDSKRNKFDLCSTFKTWIIWNNHPTWIEQFPSFIYLQMSSCELAICVIVLFLPIDKVLHSIWRDVCCFDLVCSKFEINSPYELLVCKNFEMQMLHYTLNPLQMLCIKSKYNLDDISHVSLVGS